jgi:1-acyl-sn-glycerol-3-phosphate acyltransferase
MLLLWIRSTLFFLGMAISAILFSPFAIASAVLPILPRMRFIGWWARFIMFWLRVTCKIDHQVQGLEYLPTSPAVILSKHQSAWETIAFQAIFPPQTWALKREALWIPFFGWGLAATRPIAINRATPIRALDQLLEQGKKRLIEGRWVVIFPEGTRMPPGVRGRYSPGGATLAVHSETPVVPVAHNAGLYWGRRRFIKQPGIIRICIGPAIQVRGRNPRAVNQEAEDWIENKMATLLKKD